MTLIVETRAATKLLQNEGACGALEQVLQRCQFKTILRVQEANT